MQSQKTKIGLVWILRWAARLFSIVVLVTLALFFVGEVPTPGRVPARELAGLAFFPLGVAAGMVIAWRREGLGAAIGLTSLACFYGIYGLWLRGSASGLGWWFIVFSSPLLLFLITWLLSRRSTHRSLR